MAKALSTGQFLAARHKTGLLIVFVKFIAFLYDYLFRYYVSFYPINL